MLFAATPAAAREEPLWEAGFGLAALDFPDYRGSSHSRGYILPAPYFVYRGDIVKADRSGMRGTFFSNRDIDLHLSVGASLPVSSDKNPEREGMPNLRPSIELGPSLDFTLWRSAGERYQLDLRFPIRAAVTLESHPEYAGAQFSPNLNLDIHDPLDFTGWNLGLLAGPVYTDARYNRRFYEVAPEFATPSRPAFAAPGGGYGGVHFIAALSKRFPKFWAGGFVRYDRLDGAVFESSPLVTTKRYVAGGIGFTWIFKESATRVPVNEYGEDIRR
jgi:outer membrane protein